MADPMPPGESLSGISSPRTAEPLLRQPNADLLLDDMSTSIVGYKTTPTAGWVSWFVLCGCVLGLAGCWFLWGWLPLQEELHLTKAALQKANADATNLAAQVTNLQARVQNLNTVRDALQQQVTDQQQAMQILQASQENLAQQLEEPPLGTPVQAVKAKKRQSSKK